VIPEDGKPTGKLWTARIEYGRLSVPRLGFHATTADGFAQALHNALSLSPDDDIMMRARGRESAVRRFSEHKFEQSWDASGWKKWL
jgi:alpha-1,2-mannosyltransferase